jgi:EEF1A lysine methyltransferase 1
VFYDFNRPEDLPKELHHAFELVVIDPPFITREVWQKYAEAAKLLLVEGGHCLLSTIDENESMIKELLGANRCAFRPSIPNLVYQYSLYASFTSEGLCQKNPEIPDFD